MIRGPVCASDGVQDLSECHLRKQACLADINVTTAKRGRCGKCMITWPSLRVEIPVSNGYVCDIAPSEGIREVFDLTPQNCSFVSLACQLQYCRYTQ